jgi:hypothetical protein
MFAHSKIRAAADESQSDLVGRWRRRGKGMRVSERLLLLIGCCLLPALGLYALIGFNLWKERKVQLADLAVHQAELLAGDIDSITEGARILLASAAEFHQVRSQGVDCSARLTGLRRNVPSFAFLVYLDAEGRIG